MSVFDLPEPTGEVWVRKNDGKDLIDCCNSYSGKTIRMSTGIHTIDEKIIAPTNDFLRIEGHSCVDTIIKSNGAFDAIIDTVKENTLGIHLKNLCIDGDNLAINGIRIYALNQTYPHWKRNVILENVKVVYTEGYGINLTNPVADALEVSAVLQNCVVRDTQGGVYLDMADCKIDGLYTGATQDDAGDAYLAALYIKRGGNQICNVYPFSGFKHGIYCSSSWNNFSNIHIDNMRHHGFVMYGGKYNTIAGMSISQCGQETDNTYSGLRMTAGADFNNFTGLTIGLREPAEPKCKYGIEEVAGSDYNNYGIVVYEKDAFGTAKSLLQGTGSLITELVAP